MEDIAKLGNGIHAHTSSQKPPHSGLQNLGQHPSQGSLLYDKLEMEQWQLFPVNGASCHPSEPKGISVRTGESCQSISCLLQKVTWSGKIVPEWVLEILCVAYSSQVLWQHRVLLRRMNNYHDGVRRLILDSKFIHWEKLTMFFFSSSPPPLLFLLLVCLDWWKGRRESKWKTDLSSQGWSFSTSPNTTTGTTRVWPPTSWAIPMPASCYLVRLCPGRVTRQCEVGEGLMDGGKERWRKRKGLEVSQVEQMKGIRKERKREREKKLKHVRMSASEVRKENGMYIYLKWWSPEAGDKGCFKMPKMTSSPSVMSPKLTRIIIGQNS